MAHDRTLSSGGIIGSSRNAGMPYVFRTTVETIPAEVPYVHVEPASLPLSNKLKVGLVWRSGEWDERRSIPFRALLPLSEVAGVEWHLLQRDARLAGWNGEFGAITGGDNPLEDARIMRALDLVISVDTMTAHLAGALGQPIWTLLPFEPDWRWLARSRRQSLVPDDASVSTTKRRGLEPDH